MGLSLMLARVFEILMNSTALSHISSGSHALVTAELLDYIYSSSTRSLEVSNMWRLRNLYLGHKSVK